MKIEYQDMIDRALQGDKDAINSFESLFNTYINADETASMLRKIEDAIELDENNSYTYFLKGEIYYLRKDKFKNYAFKNYDIAIENFKKSSALGNTEAMTGLGIMCWRGLGFSADTNAAIAWFEKASALGNDNAMFYLGHMYHDGKDVPADYTKSTMWYEQAIACGNANAMNSLGFMHLSGNGRKINYKAAIDFFNDAIALNNDYAMLNRGYMYHKGLGGPVDCDAASDLFFKAHKMNNAQAIGGLVNISNKNSHVKSQLYLILIYLKQGEFNLINNILIKNLKGISKLLYQNIIDFFDDNDSLIEVELLDACINLLSMIMGKNELEIRYVRLKQYLYEKDEQVFQYLHDNYFLKEFLSEKDYFNLGSMLMELIAKEDIESNLHVLNQAYKFYLNAHKKGNKEAIKYCENISLQLNSLKNNSSDDYQSSDFKNNEKIISKNNFFYSKKASRILQDHITSLEAFIFTLGNKIHTENNGKVFSQQYFCNDFDQVKLARSILNQLKNKKELADISREMQSEIIKFRELDDLIKWRLEEDVKLISYEHNQSNNYRM